MSKGSKIDIVSGLFMFMLVGIADAADAAALLVAAVPIIGWGMPIFAWFFGLAISAILVFWLYNIGVSIKWFLPGSGIELIPGLNGLPLRTIALILTFIEDKLPIAPTKEIIGKADKTVRPKLNIK